MANQCSLVPYDCGDGYDYWPGAINHWPTNTGNFRNCRSYNYGAVLSNIAGLSSASSCVVTWTNHGLSNGDVIFITGITQGSSANWESLNNRRFKVSSAATNSFTLTLMDGSTTINTSTWPPYTPDTNGKYTAWNGGWRFRNAQMNMDAECISEGGNPVDDVFIDNISMAQIANYSIPLSHMEDTPLGANLYLRYDGGKIDWAKGSVDAFDTLADAYGIISFTCWNGGILRMPGDNPSWGPMWEFKKGSVYGTGSSNSTNDPTNTSNWYGGVAPYRLTIYNPEDMVNPYSPSTSAVQLSYYYCLGAYFARQPNYNTSRYSGSDGGVRCESVYNSNNAGDSGGVGCYDSTNNQATMMHLKSALVPITVSAATQTISNFIPAGAIVYGFTAYVTTAIGGATSLSVGSAASPNLWLNAMGVAPGSQGTLANATATGPAIYPTAANVLLTANGGSFNGTGAVRICCHYIALEPPTN